MGRGPGNADEGFRPTQCLPVLDEPQVPALGTRRRRGARRRRETQDASFFILDGAFSFNIGDQIVEATPGTYLLVPRETKHTITAAEGGGRFLTLRVPGGVEEMFFELGTLATDAIRDPVARAAVAARYDSIPV